VSALVEEPPRTIASVVEIDPVSFAVTTAEMTGEDTSVADNEPESEVDSVDELCEASVAEIDPLSLAARVSDINSELASVVDIEPVSVLVEESTGVLVSVADRFPVSVLETVIETDDVSAVEREPESLPDIGSAPPPAAGGSRIR
jgi:hypothetical protein